MTPMERIERELQEARQRIAELKREVEIHATAEEVQIALREKAEERKQALAAHVEHLSSIAEKISTVAPEYLDHLASDAAFVLRSTPATSLAHLKVQWQAEALETLYHDCLGHGGDGMIRVGTMLDRAIELRQQAEAEQ